MALRVAFIGAGSIVRTHMRALESLGRAEVVASWSQSQGAGPDRMLLEAAPDAVFVCVPPYVAPTMCRLLVDRGIPFLVEKPVAALDETAVCQLADDVESQGLVAAVGYQLRGLDFLDRVREAISLHPPPLVIARWTGGTPSSDWWVKPEMSGGQVIEQMTHFYDLARCLLGESRVVAAASRQGHDGELALATTALLRFDAGAVGAFVNTRVADRPLIELELTSTATIGLTTERGWTLGLPGQPPVATRRSPYAVQAEAFLTAVENKDPGRVLATFRDGLATYQLTRTVVAAAGAV